jgi:hypothetical protein
METVDEEITSRALDWMEKQAKADKTSSWGTTHTAMHLRTHLAEKNVARADRTITAIRWSRMIVSDTETRRVCSASRRSVRRNRSFKAGRDSQHQVVVWFAAILAFHGTVHKPSAKPIRLACERDPASKPLFRLAALLELCTLWPITARLPG